MKNSNLLFVIAIIFLSSCSASYHQINPHYSSYESAISNNVELKYKYDILELSDNKRYYKKSQYKELEIIGIEVVNNSNETIYLDKNFGVFSEETRYKLIPPDETMNKIQQGVWGHLAYLLLTPLKLNITDPDGLVKVYPIGYVLGPAIAILNITGASSSNKKFRMELEQYNILTKPILPGKSEKGIIAIQSKEEVPLSLKKLE